LTQSDIARLEARSVPEDWHFPCSHAAPISTSLVERQNLTMRMSMRRFTRLTNAFSKKVENLHAAVALHFAHYNFVRLHRSLNVTPAMEAGVSNRLWSLEELVERVSK
jgi:IS1 transposase